MNKIRNLIFKVLSRIDRANSAATYRFGPFIIAKLKEPLDPVAVVFWKGVGITVMLALQNVTNFVAAACLISFLEVRRFKKAEDERCDRFRNPQKYRAKD